MKTFLEKFYEKLAAEKGFDCIDFEYDGVEYQVSDGHYICFTDKSGKIHELKFPKDTEILLDAKVLQDGKSLREIWGSADCESLPSYWY